MSGRSLAALASLVATLACQQGPGGPTDLESAVFSGEARLGGTAAIAIDSNYIPASDPFELYDIAPSRVSVFITDDLDVEVQAIVRAVFPLAQARSSKLAAAGRWITVALFDLPESGLTTPAEQGRVRVVLDGTTEIAHSTIRIVGDGGSPWLPPPPGVTPLEMELESRSLLRLRAVRRDPQTGGSPIPADAFLDTWQIGGLELEVDYPDCLEPPDAFPNTEAVNATALVEALGSPGAGLARARVVLIAPLGFQVQHPNDPLGVSPATVAGEGPILDLAFDRDGSEPGCPGIAPADFAIRKLFATDTNGQTLIDRRTSSTDSSDLVTSFVLDAEER